jgi:hypothetical protein
LPLQNSTGRSIAPRSQSVSAWVPRHACLAALSVLRAIHNRIGAIQI